MSQGEKTQLTFNCRGNRHLSPSALDLVCLISAGKVFRSLKHECLSRMIFFGEQSLRRAVTDYLDHYRAEPNHQGLDNKILEPGREVGISVGELDCRERLAGMLKYYYRKAS